MTKLFFIALFIFLPKPLWAINEKIILSEIMYDYPGSDEKQEWLEMKNISYEDIIIDSNWRIFDGSNHLLTLFQGQNLWWKNSYLIIAEDPTTFLTNYPNQNATIYKSAISLTNQADFLKISTDRGQTWLTETSYNKEMGASGDGRTLEWDDSGQFWRPSFVLSGTPGKTNSALADLPHYSANIYINEILPNPSTAQNNEFIEIYNHSDNEVDLSNWLFDDSPNNGNSPYSIPTGSKIGPKTYLVFSHQQTNINLDNSGEVIRLLFPDQKEAQVIFYPQSHQDLSYQRTAEGNWQFSSTSTPGQENIFSPLESANFAQEFVAPAKEASLTTPKSANKSNIVMQTLLTNDLAKNNLSENIISQSLKTTNQAQAILEQIIQSSGDFPETSSQHLTKPAKNFIIGANILAIFLLILLWKKPTLPI